MELCGWEGVDGGVLICFLDFMEVSGGFFGGVICWGSSRWVD